MFSKYTLSILLAIIGFVTSVVLTKNLLHFYPPIEREIYVVDSANINYLDTIKIDNRYLNFQAHVANSDDKKMLEAKKDQLALYSEFYFNDNPSLLLWMTFMAIGIAFSFGMTPLLGYFFFTMESTRKIHAGIAALAGMVLVFFFAHFGSNGIILLPPRIMELTHLLYFENEWLLQTLVGAYMIPPLLSLASNFVILDELVQYKTGKKDVEPKRLLKLKKSLFWLLSASSVMLVMGIITSSLLRETVISAVGNENANFFPSDFVLAYSIVFTFFLLLFYVPGNLLLGDILSSNRFGANTSEQKKDSNNGYSNKESFELSLSILAPVISGLLIEWLK
ncbi:MAG: hypothetical protein AAFN93_11420 [Bacteroidota bacterium]